MAPRVIARALNLRHGWLTVATPAHFPAMTLLRRLCLCLLALALLPGATLQARMLAMPLAAAAHATVVQTDHGTPAAACHDAAPAPDAGSGNVHARDAGEAPDDCCGGGTSPADCSQHCACPAATPALPLAESPIGFDVRQPLQSVAGLHGTARLADGPPKRPPIG